MWEDNDGVEVRGATMEVNGSTVSIDSGIDLKEVVLKFARDAGYKKFRFYINGEEVLPQDAPGLTESGVAYKITAFDVAG